MWNDFILLLCLGLALTISAYVVGSLPLWISLDARYMRLLTACGIGALIGTSLIIIIPEGIETLYQSQSPHHEIKRWHSHRQVEGNGFQPYHTPDSCSASDQFLIPPSNVGMSMRISPKVDQQSNEMVASHKRSNEVKSKVEQEPSKQTTQQTPPEASSLHSWVGLTLISGFAVMYLIDKIPDMIANTFTTRPVYISLEQIGIRRTPELRSAEFTTPLSPSYEDGQSRPSATTTGLLIHAVADGIALGASITSDSKKLGFVITVAMIVHRLPAAFGLTSILLKQGHTKKQIKIRLLLFSIAAPIGALLTWAAVQISSGESAQAEVNKPFLIGVLLLFSGGTFLLAFSRFRKTILFLTRLGLLQLTPYKAAYCRTMT